MHNTMPGDKNPATMIKIQGPFCVNAHDVNKSKSELIFSIFCFTLERIEKDIDGILFNTNERATVYICFS